MKLVFVLSIMAALAPICAAQAQPAGQTLIAPGQTVTARMAPTGRTEADCFRFVLPRGATYDVVVRSAAFDARASVYGSCGGALQNLDNAGGRDERLVSSSLSGGDRFIAVDAGGTGGGAYVVSVKVYPVDPNAYAPPPTPAAMAGWSAARIWTDLNTKLGRVADFTRLTPDESLWVRYHISLSSAQHAAGVTRWVDANIHWPNQDAQRAAAASRAQAASAAPQAPASRLSTYERGVFAEALTALAAIPDDAEGLSRGGNLFHATRHCGNITTYLARLSWEERARADAECPWADINRMNAAGIGWDNRLPGIAGNPISPLAPSAAGTGNVNVRTYDGRTGTYTGTTVMTPLEAELRGARPQ